jgi:hypothetical protein
MKRFLKAAKLGCRNESDILGAASMNENGLECG